MSDSESESDCLKITRKRRRSCRESRRRVTNICRSTSESYLIRKDTANEENDFNSGHSLSLSPDSKSGGYDNKPICSPTGEMPNNMDESSMESNSSSEKCPICFHAFKNQRIGIPNSCTHMYCAKCIMDWSQDVWTCPIDRLSFSSISVLENIKSFLVVAEIPINSEKSDTKNAQNSSDYEMPIVQNILRARSNSKDMNEDSIQGMSSGEKCTICFSTFKDQEIGIPNSCNHRYCGKCIEEWSNTVRTCPIDRQPFTLIIIMENNRSENKIREISVSENPVEIVETDEEGHTIIDDEIYCMECNHSNNEETMLLCDSCNRGYHMACLCPPFTEVPTGDWFCDTCSNSTDLEALFQQRQTRRNRTRRVRSRQYQRTRSRRTCRIPIRSLLSNLRRNSSAAAVSVAENEENYTGKSSMWERHRAEVPSLSLFGMRNQLDYFLSEDESDHENIATRNSGSVGLMVAPSRSRTSTMSSLYNRKGILNSILTPSEPSSVDLLSDIINDQEMWHNLSRRNDTKNVRISTDGSLDFSDIVKSRKHSDNNKDILPSTHAPMYPRGGRGTGGFYNIHRQGGNREGGVGNFRNNYSGNYQGNYLNTNYNNHFNRENSSNYGNFQGSAPGGHGRRENFPNSFQPFQFRNNNQRGRQQFPLRSRGQGFTPNRFNQRNQARDNFESFDNHAMLDNIPTGDIDMNLSGISGVNRIENDELTNVHNLDAIVGHSNVSSLMNVNSNKEDATSIETIPTENSQRNLDTSRHQYRDEYNNTTQNDEDQAYAEFNYPNVTPLLQSETMPEINPRYDDIDDDCPNFSVYSTQAMMLANNVHKPNNQDNLISNVANCEDNEEDLVQMDDNDENFEKEKPNPSILSKNSNSSEQNITDDGEMIISLSSNVVVNDLCDLENIPMPESDLQSIPIPSEKPICESTNTNNALVRREKKNVLELYDDSDWEELNLIKTNNDRPAFTENIHVVQTVTEQNETAGELINNIEEHDTRSYTPCLDEKSQLHENTEKEEDDGDTIDINAHPMDAGGIGGMETEMISDEDCVLNNGNMMGIKVPSGDKDEIDPSKKTDSNEKEKRIVKCKSQKSKEFKKLSRNNRDRNYRDRERGRNRSRSRSYSNGNEINRRGSFSKRKDKRKDMVRYDVRNVVEDRWQRRSRKDQYGRDTSRHRSLSSTSPRRYSYSRSVSRTSSRRLSKSSSRSPHRSKSREHQPYRSRHSSSRNRQKRRSLSRTGSPLRRRSSSRKRSFSHKRSISPIRKRNRSYDRSPSPSRSTAVAVSFNHRRSKSHRVSPKGLEFSPNRERVKPQKRRKGTKEGRLKAKKNKKKHPTTDTQITPPRDELKRTCSNVDSSKPSKKTKKNGSRSRSKSWNVEENRAVSFSMSPPPRENFENEPISWTPPLRQNDIPLCGEFTSQTQLKETDSKSRKKEKKRNKQDKKRGDAWERRLKRGEKQSASKEVFASGNNILVSVSFNNDDAQVAPQQTTIVTLPPTKHGLLQKRRSDRAEGGAKKSRRDKSKHSGSKGRKRKVDSKPVAIIDLDKSPFKEITPSPKAVIVLSDSDGGDDEEKNKSGGTTRMNLRVDLDDLDSRTDSGTERREHVSQPQSPNPETNDTFMIQTLGPKTPPEPEHVKFTLKLKNKTRSTRPNVLADEEEEDIPSEPEESQRNNSTESVSKIGPNTPPEPAPCSPDAYDPFEPTKSPSQSRSPIVEAANTEVANQETLDSNVQSQGSEGQDMSDISVKHVSTVEKVMNPVDLVMALMNSTTSHPNISTENSNTTTESKQNTRISASPQEQPEEIMPLKPSSSGITIISNVLIQPSKNTTTVVPTVTSSSMTNSLIMPQTQIQTEEKSPAKLSIVTSSAGMKPISMKTPAIFSKASSASLISKLPLPKVGNTSQLGTRYNGDQDIIEMDSPYSPASSDFDGLFDPPSDQMNRPNLSRSSNTSASQPTQRVSPTKGAKSATSDIFDTLFGAISPAGANTTSRSQQKSKLTKTIIRSQSKRTAIKGSKVSTPIGLDETAMRIVDEVPGSAVELHFLRKLNRQERVVEEVKLVLKPHYNKKHITKDEYKDILRKAVPKICHSRTGEINPQKIQALIEAYVRKFRIKRKLSGSQTGGSSGSKSTKPLWA
ncbi:putative uncharacterized protein DDB_G0282133 isoform X2 [Phlebotomus argentipes]|uniref:putative uncharacterized protein DDB_G0282133 isoform X2 n=1 Tax=Phlebotomus argentipes TaxID=94469 RepID=UPI0028937E1B|nr:putative uncharacterized protein DDB_G0282133 isoform X2 [Phlebotomus argentipes]